MDWGKKIIIVYSTFAVLILVLVALSMRQKIDLIEVKYYEEELKHQIKLDANQNYSKLNTEIKINSSGNNYGVELPDIILNNLKSGTIKLIRLSDSQYDAAVQLDAKSKYIDLKPYVKKKGYYKVLVEWKDSTKAYYYEDFVNFKI